MKEGDIIQLPSGRKLTFRITDEGAFKKRELMDRKSRNNWIRALRSGKYKQAHGVLCDEREARHCCLGVKLVIDKVPQSGSPNASYGVFHINNHIFTAELPVGYEKGLETYGGFSGFELKDTKKRIFVGLAHLNDCRYAFIDIAHIIKLFF
jgi:hypothetical protein